MGVGRGRRGFVRVGGERWGGGGSGLGCWMPLWRLASWVVRNGLVDDGGLRFFADWKLCFGLAVSRLVLA